LKKFELQKMICNFYHEVLFETKCLAKVESF
jgi:hypothetical protein